MLRDRRCPGGPRAPVVFTQTALDLLDVLGTTDVTQAGAVLAARFDDGAPDDGYASVFVAFDANLEPSLASASVEEGSGSQISAFHRVRPTPPPSVPALSLRGARATGVALLAAAWLGNRRARRRAA